MRSDMVRSVPDNKVIVHALRESDAGIGGALLAVRAMAHELAGLIDAAGRYTRLAQRSLEPREDDAAIAAALSHLDRAARTLDFAVDSMRHAVAVAQPGALSERDGAVPTIGEAAAHAARVTAPLANQRAVAVSVGVASDAADVAIPGLANALTNLLRNAVQAAPAATGRVRLEALVEAGAVVIRVIDNGPGPADAPRPGVSTTGGMGLGLLITSSIARRAGGTLTLDRTPSGAVAALRFPRDTPALWALDDWGE